MSLVIFRLLDRRENPDSFFQNSDGTRDLDRKLNFTNTRSIVNPFWIIDQKTGGRVYKRWINGCAHFDVEQQDKEKLVANSQNSIIQFEKGADIILDTQFMNPLIKFLRIHPENSVSENHNEEKHEAVFYEVDPKKETKKQLDAINAEDEAMDVYRSLTKNVERMRSVAMLFEETKGLIDDEEIQVALRSVAKDQPTRFKDSIANVENKVLSDVLIAQKFGIVGKDAKGFYYEGENGGILFETTSKQKIAEKELVDYLMTKEGQIQYQNLLVKIGQDEVKRNAPAGILGDGKKEEGK